MKNFIIILVIMSVIIAILTAMAYGFLLPGIMVGFVWFIIGLIIYGIWRLIAKSSSFVSEAVKEKISHNAVYDSYYAIAEKGIADASLNNSGDVSDGELDRMTDDEFKENFDTGKTPRNFTCDDDFTNGEAESKYEDAKIVAMFIYDQVTSKALARQFILEELDAARHGSDMAQKFVENSGFEPIEYIGAMNNTGWGSEENQLEELQTMLLSWVFMFKDNKDLMVKWRLSVIDELMRLWKLGKYVV